MPTPWAPASLPGVRVWNLIRTVVQLQAAAPGTSSGSGTLGKTATLQGLATASSTGSAALSRKIPVQGSAAGTSGGSGVFGYLLSLSGSAAGSSGASADLETFTYVYIEGSATGTSAGSAHLSIDMPVASSAAGSSAGTGTLSLSGGLAGSAAGTSGASALMGRRYGFVGSAAGFSSAHATMSATRIGLQGSAAGFTSVFGRLSVPRLADYPDSPITLVFGQYATPVPSASLTLDPDEPGTGIRSAWWYWETNSSREVDFDGRRTSLASGSTAPSWVLEVYTGADLDHLELVGSTTSSGLGYVRLDVVAGQRFWVRMAQTDPDQTLVYDVWVHQVSPSTPTTTIPGDSLIASGRRNNAARAAFL